EPHRQPVHPGRRLRRGRPLHRAPAPARADRPRRRDHLRQPGRGRHLGGRVLGEPEHRLHRAPAGALRRGRQRLRHLGPGLRAGPRAHQRAGARVRRPARLVDRRHRLPHRARDREGGGQQGPGRRRPRAHPRPGDPPLLALGRRHPEQVPAPQELEGGALPDPIDNLERTLVEGGIITRDEAQEIRAEAKRIVADAAKKALAAVRPDPSTVLDHVVALPDIPDPGEAPPAKEGDELVAMGEAIRRTLHEVMAADERVRVFGEDVADAREAILADVEGKGGVFGTTHGLQRSFGRARCYNTPLAEANIIGRAVGQAIRGLRPAPEIQFFDYIWPAMQQIRSEAATIRWRSNGAFTCPTVIRVPIGGYLQGGAIWHSQSGESIFTRVPGLLVAFPSRASDAAGLLRAAFRCDDPVLFLEHKHLLRQPYTRDPFPPADHVIPFGRGRYVTRGTDLTIVTWGATVERSRQAAEQLAQEGASVEI